ncbi:hypothetical protein Angca_007154 [Angiostrongylus cantonensis]|nr:hypothetical protein Angca_007154 [Angiostrongylus cantonensis]
MIYVPPGAEAKFNHVASLNIIICFVCIATFQVLSRFNKKQCSVRTATLTTRYQTRENVVTTEFASHIATIQVFFFVFYGACGILIRVFGPVLFSNNEKLYTSVRQICFVNPIFMVLLPIYSIHRLKHYRVNRDRDIRSIVMIESRGLAGTRNYEDVIGRAWEHIPQP